MLAMASFAHKWVPYMTSNNWFIRWSPVGVFNGSPVELAAKGGKPDPLVINALYLKAHRMMASLRKNDLSLGRAVASKTGTVSKPV